MPNFLRQGSSTGDITRVSDFTSDVGNSSHETLSPFVEYFMTDQKNRDAMQGVTLERILTELHAQYGWESLAEKIHIRCFQENPSVISSLKFLRRTPWARTKVERLYIKLVKRQGAILNRNKEE